MKILFFTTAHNSLSQRAFVELVDRGHTVIVVIASSEEVMLEAVEREHPDLIVAPVKKSDSCVHLAKIYLYHRPSRNQRRPRAIFLGLGHPQCLRRMGRHPLASRR